ncbi:MAG: hypothetical protein K1X74_04890 [Pirellulales bacterium]|nr:hypothetical protein [Pirellulales bacterium]
MAANQRTARNNAVASEPIDRLPATALEQVKIVLRLPDLAPAPLAAALAAADHVAPATVQPQSALAAMPLSADPFASAAIDSWTIDLHAVDQALATTSLRTLERAAHIERPPAEISYQARPATSASLPPARRSPVLPVDAAATDAVFEATAASDQALAIEVAQQAAQVVRHSLHPTRVARLLALFGGFSSLLVRPEIKLVLAVVGLVRAARLARANASAGSATIASTSAQPGLPRMMQALAQPNALLAAVLALACVLLLVLLNGGSGEPAAAPATSQVATKQPAKDAAAWNSPLTAAVVEPNKPDAPPFKPANSALSAPALAQPSAAGSDVAPQATPDSPPPPAPTSTATAASAPAPVSASPMPPPNQVRRSPTVGTNQPLSLATVADAPPAGTQAAGNAPAVTNRVKVHPPRRVTDSFGMPVEHLPPTEPNGKPAPPHIEPPPGGFDHLGPQTVYPATQSRSPELMARRLPPTTTIVRTPPVAAPGAKLQGVIQAVNP